MRTYVRVPLLSVSWLGSSLPALYGNVLAGNEFASSGEPEVWTVPSPSRPQLPRARPTSATQPQSPALGAAPRPTALLVKTMGRSRVPIATSCAPGATMRFPLDVRSFD